MKILITGGSGFIGQHLASRLVKEGEFVVVYDINDSAPNQDDPNNPNLIKIRGDIQDKDRLIEVLSSYQIDQVVHLATVLTAECAINPLRATQINCCGAAGLFEAAVKCRVPRVIYGSSVAVFDDNPALPTGDLRPYGPPAVYGVTKVFVEQLAQAMQRDNPGTDFLGIRYGWVYGPGRVRGWTEIQEVIENFSLEKEIIDFPNYQKPLDWTYIDDAVEAMVRCLQNPFPERPVLNFSGDYRSIDDANSYLRSLFPKAKLRPYPADLPPVGWGFKSDGISIHLGYSFETSLEQGLLKTVNWIRTQNKLSLLPVE